MCKWGTSKVVKVTMQPDYYNYFTEWIKDCKVDSCIADIVETLEYNNVRMLASCCGHGKDDGKILLKDRSELIIPKKFIAN